MSNFEVQGMEQLVKKLETMGSASNKISNSALQAGGKIIVNAQKSDAPRRTGTGAGSGA